MTDTELLQAIANEVSAALRLVPSTVEGWILHDRLVVIAEALLERLGVWDA